MTAPGDRLAMLLPCPARVVGAAGEWSLPDVLGLHVETGDADVARRVLRSARAILPAAVVPSGPGAAGLRVIVGPDVGTGVPGGYRLKVTADGCRVEASGFDGAVAALHTLVQLLPADAARQWQPDDARPVVPACLVEDAPVHQWRGVLLDVARHFMPKREIVRHIRLLAGLKINRVQLHLTDDQGWRIESRAHPELHRRGSWREQSQVSHFLDEAVLDGTPHGGHLTLADLTEIAGIAADLGVQVVPEVEVPGHTGAFLSALPHLSCGLERPREVSATWGIHDSLVRPTAEALDVLTDVLREVHDALPGDFLHLGGDEALVDRWADDGPSRDEMARRGVATPGQMLGAFLDDLESRVRGWGRTVLVWDDAFAAAGEVPGGAADAEVAGDRATRVVVAWRGAEVARRAAAAGHRVVLAPIWPTYLDYAQSTAADEPLAIGAAVTLEDVAAWRPVPADWTDAERANVLGVQAQLWTEFVPDARTVDYMLYPRALAVAEVAWADGRRVPADVVDAVRAQLPRLDAMGVEYRPPEGPHPWQQGGHGRRRNRPTPPLVTTVELHARAAAEGRVPDESEYAPVEDGGR